MKINRANRQAAVDAESAKPLAAVAASTAPAAPAQEPGIEELVVHLLGRIMLIEQDGQYWALFLDAQKNKALEFPRHRPLLRASIEDTDEASAGLAEVTFADASGRVHACWKLDDHDIHFTGLDTKNPKPKVSLDAIADLPKIYATVDPEAKWVEKSLLLGPKPRDYGILARLSLNGFEEIDSMFFEQNGALKQAHEAAVLNQDREFLPLSALPKTKTETEEGLPSVFKQVVHAIIRCRARVRTAAAAASNKPTVVMTPYAGGDAKQVAFNDSEPLQLSFSNLCHCVGHDAAIEAKIAGVDRLLEDNEFAVYYELLANPPAKDQRPLPFCRKEGAGGGGVPQCVPVGKG
jgi:hypothetical protein